MNINNMIFLIFGAIVGCVIAAPSEYSEPSSLADRIVGGQTVDIVDYPYQVGLYYERQFICGGSIIDSEWIITAAHCVDGGWVGYHTVQAGSSNYLMGGTWHGTAALIIHPSFNRQTTDYDIAVLKVSPAFNIGQPGINTIALPASGTVVNTGVMAVVSGWGRTHPDSSLNPLILQAVQVPIISTQDCKPIFADGVITDRMVCAGYAEGGRDACNGDSGGPLVANGVLVGVVSWGYRCAAAVYPGVYVDVGTLRDWVRQNTGV